MDEPLPQQPKTRSVNTTWPNDLPRVLLVGAGVVGRSIAEAHAVRDVPFCLADQSEDALLAAAKSFSEAGFAVRHVDCVVDGLFTIAVGQPSAEDQPRPLMVVESIVEQVSAKRRLFRSIQDRFGQETILSTNTSTLQIDEIAGQGLEFPESVCGMHFFMPVHRRGAVEVVRGRRTSDRTIEAVTAHCQRIGKRAIFCQDGPGFVVNRMLSPYLNQALLLLCRGATADQMERAARAYGMPLSPLELIDWIGAATMYHAGRAFCNAFPTRIDPSPVVPALVKRKRLGRAVGQGLYDYVDGQRSERLAAETVELIEMYRIENREFTDGEVLMLLSIPMWIEATGLLEEGIADSMETVDLAMAGGLGFHSHTTWSKFFDELGQATIESAIHRWQGVFRSMRPR